MKTLIHLLFFFLLSFTGINTATAQHEYYTSCAYTYAVPMTHGGNLFRTDSLGLNPHILYNFDSTTGGMGVGSVIQATNGKLYGFAAYGGTNNNGVLFEYDPILDSYQVKQNLVSRCMAALMQASNGKIYFTTTGNDGYLTEYDISTNTLTQRQYLPYPQYPLGRLAEANGKLYGITSMGGTYGYGRIYEYNLTTHVFSYIHDFNHSTEGSVPQGGMVLAANGLLYGTTVHPAGSLASNAGALYSINPVTLAYTQLLNIPADIGYGAFLTVAPNNKIYGMSSQGGTDISGNHWGSIFEYDYTANTIRITHSFGMQANGDLTGTSYTMGGLTLASNGKMYGANAYTSFEYNYLTDSVKPRSTAIGMETNTNGYFLEICRKPSYKYFHTDTAALCVGNPFTFTVHSDNAKAFAWKKNGVLLPSQTDSILNIASASLTDSGNYTCFMTNQCGNTETMSAIRLEVNTLPVTGIISGTPAVCEGSTTTLSYSVAGTGVWVSGSTPTATVESTTGVVSGIAAGPAIISYIAYNTCGSAIVSTTITVNPLPVVAAITGVNNICTGATITFSNAASGGTWSSSNTTAATISNAGTVTGIAAGTSIISYAITNSCGTAQATAIVTVDPLPNAGTITGTTNVCPGNTITLSNAVVGGTWASADNTIATITPSGIVTGIAPGTVAINYSVTNTCGTDVATFTVQVLPLSVCNTSTGIAAAHKVLALYPNPNTGTFTINIPSAANEEAQIMIRNIKGEVLKEFTTGTNKTFNIALEFAPGIYILSAITTQDKYEAKLVIIK